MVSLQTLLLAAVLVGSNDLVLLDFGAEWCGPCRTMEPTVQRLERAGYPVRRVDIDQNPDLARRFGIGPVPCFVLAKNGHEMQRIVGATSHDRLVRMFQQAGYENRASSGRSGNRAESQQDPRSPAPRQTQPTHSPPLNSSRPASHDARDDSTPSATAASASEESRLNRAHERALQATVRLRIADADGYSNGTGTIIDIHGNEALVLTCGHIFRASQGKGEIQVKLFAPGSRKSVPGQLLAYECDERDFGLVIIRPDVPVTPVTVAPTTHRPRKGHGIFSIGCNHGAEPTVRVSTISAVDRYVGPPNIEIHGHPVEGRSGGGLFTPDGQIIGICNAADLQEDRGIYAGLPTIHLALDRIGQRNIYLAQDSPPKTVHSDDSHSPPPNRPASGNSPSTASTVGPVSRSSQSGPSEAICILRSTDGTSRVVVISGPSQRLLQQMTAESQQQIQPAQHPSTTSSSRNIARLSELPSSSPPVVRGQSR